LLNAIKDALDAEQELGLLVHPGRGLADCA
jgi:hypothetical protein